MVLSALAELQAIGMLARAAAEPRDSVLRSAPSLHGDWRVVGSVPAPWAELAQGRAAIDPGARVRPASDRLDGPHPIGCGSARFEHFDVPPQGLFEGSLPNPERDAARLGLRVGPVASLRAICANASLDFHLADPWTVLFGLDSRVYTMSRAPGALADDGTPESGAQRLLEHHFAGDRAFSAAAWAGKQELLDPVLAERLAAYFAADWPQDEPPSINGDPLTMSQERATRFAVFAAEIRDGVALVPVRLADEQSDWTIALELAATASGWRLTDVVDERGERLVDGLAERP